MPQIMKKGSKSENLSSPIHVIGARPQRIVKSQPLSLLLVLMERGEHSIRKVNAPKRVLESTVNRAWIDQMSHCQLANIPQPLERRRVDDRQLRISKLDEAMNRISNLADGTMRICHTTESIHEIRPLCVADPDW